MNLDLLLFKAKLGQIKKVVWNRGIFLFWCLLWIRKNEFHYSLSIDVDALNGASEKFSIWYWRSLSKRREIAHRKDMRAMDRLFFFRVFTWKSA